MTDNNAAELLAATRGIEAAAKVRDRWGSIHLNTDSQYVVGIVDDNIEAGEAGRVLRRLVHAHNVTVVSGSFQNIICS